MLLGEAANLLARRRHVDITDAVGQDVTPSATSLAAWPGAFGLNDEFAILGTPWAKSCRRQIAGVVAANTWVHREDDDWRPDGRGEVRGSRIHCDRDLTTLKDRERLGEFCSTAKR